MEHLVVSLTLWCGVHINIYAIGIIMTNRYIVVYIALITYNN